MDAAQAVPAHRQKVLRSAWGRKFWFDPQLPSDLIEAFLTGHEDRLVAGSAGLQVKDRTVVVRHDHPQGSFVLKRHVWGGLSRTLRMSHRVSAAKRCACLGEMLAAHGIPTPPVRANLELGWGPFSYRSYLLADYVEGRSLFQLIRFEDCGETQLNSLARQVADIWRQLIALNVSHNDLKPENFIVDDQQKVWLIDFEKLRFHRSPAKMRRRHLEDLRIFLHPRNWRGQEAASDIFRRELLKTPLGGYASATRPAEGGCPDHTVQASVPHANRISVAIVVGEGEWNQASIEQTARSVRSMADEIAVVRLDERGEGFEVLEPQLPPHLRDRRGAMGRSAQFRRTQDRQLHNPWVLLMEAGEQATPDLMRELPELLEDHSDFDAVRLPVDEIYFGCSTRPHREPDSAPIRLFRQGTTFRIDDLDQLALTIESARVICFSRKINRHVYSTWGELLVELDQRAADLADERFQRADRPRLVAGAAKAALGCMRDVIWRRQYRGGWLGLQIAVTKSFFDWVVEAKLWQRANSFHSIPAAASAGSVTTQEAPPARKTKAA